MALREFRASWRRLLFFFVCIAIGVGSIVALRSIIRNFREVFTSDARSIFSADVQVDSNRPWSPQARSIVDRIANAYGQVGRAETIEASTMLRPADPSHEGAMMVELKGIEAPFPFYGTYTIEGKQFSHQLLAGRGVLVGRPVIDRLDLKVGDNVKIGDLVFQIRGILEREPGGSGGFRFGPRVLMARSDLEAAGLTGFGSRARRKILFKIPDEKLQPVVKDLRQELKPYLIRVRSYRESQENLGDQFTRAENFLSLTGLIILVLGGIGISSVTRVFVEQKRKTIAVLKCIGGTGWKIIAVYLSQVLILGLAGSFLGILLARIALWVVRNYYSATLPPELHYTLHTGAVFQGLGVGILITILFSALPLLRIRRIKPNVLLRDDEKKERRPFDLMQWSTGIAVGAGLILLSSWQAGSFRIGFFFLGGLAFTALALHFAATLLIALVRRIKNTSSFSLRYAISGLYRPGNQTRVVVMAVGLGSFFIIAVQSLQSNLLHDLDFDERKNMANMYLIDIQKDQKEELEKILREKIRGKTELVPTLRARIFAINGKQIDFESADYKKDRERLGHEYTVTYRGKLEQNEAVIAGKFWNDSPTSTPEISIEESMKGTMGLDVGGTITFDILGRKITAKVTSIRRVDWRNSRTGFYVLFRPGTLENAPQMFIAAIDGPTEQKERSRFQRLIVDRFPSISIIDVMDIVRDIRRLLNHVTLGISFIGIFVLLSGALILIGSISLTKYQRIYESAVLKTLGAKRKLLVTILFVEYGLLGIVSGIIGSLAAMALSYSVGRFVFEIPWRYTLQIYAAGIVLTVVVVIAVGALASLDVLNRKPLATLRAQ